MKLVKGVLSSKIKTFSYCSISSRICFKLEYLKYNLNGFVILPWGDIHQSNSPSVSENTSVHIHVKLQKDIRLSLMMFAARLEHNFSLNSMDSAYYLGALVYILNLHLHRLEIRKIGIGLLKIFANAHKISIGSCKTYILAELKC